MAALLLYPTESKPDDFRRREIGTVPRLRDVLRKFTVTARKQDPRSRINAQNVELYSLAYRTAWDHISALQKGQHPNMSLRLDASIRRQIREGAKESLLIAAKALSDIQTDTVVPRKRDSNGRRKRKPKTE